MSFENLGLSDKVLAAVQAAGYTTPTPIQEQAIPHVLARRDVLGIAQTGTGKTAAFTLPMLTMLEQGRAKARMPRTLILEPTRELAAQVDEEFSKYGKHHKLNMALLIGGVSFDDQDAKLSRGVDVLIATPGRLLDHFERGKLLLTGIEILVIDEADRMLDMGFIPDIERICRLIPMTRQTLFFSATMPPEIQRLADTFLHQPARIEVAKPATAAATVTQQLVATGAEPHEKRDVLRRPDPRGRRAEERHRLLQPQARGGGAVALAGQARLQRRRAARRHGPARAHRVAGLLPVGRSDHPGRLRRRRPRPRHSRGQPRLQFRRAAPRRGLRPPHRPHRPRRPLRHRGDAGQPGRQPLAGGDREAHRHPDHLDHHAGHGRRRRPARGERSGRGGSRAAQRSAPRSRRVGRRSGSKASPGKLAQRGLAPGGAQEARADSDVRKAPVRKAHVTKRAAGAQTPGEQAAGEPAAPNRSRQSSAPRRLHAADESDENLFLPAFLLRPTRIKAE